ncbi:MAG: cyclic nucleotide-binding protein, partial [Chloroflexales bacterium]|nr:cyclic nucleotide-binding protein [Chloroflexales bacterium]
MVSSFRAVSSRGHANGVGACAYWSALAERAAAPARGRPLYTGLAQRIALAGPAADRASDGIYMGLARRTDLAQYCPRRAAGVVEETLEEDGQMTLVLRSPAGVYARLSVVEAEIWRAMDGTQTAADLATMAFLRFRQLVLVPRLAQELRRDGFLADAHVGVYSGLRAREDAQGVEGWGRRVGRALRSHELAIGGIDELAGALHRWGGWALFTRAFMAILAVLVVAGGAAFALVGAGAVRQYSLIDVGNVGLSLVALWAALLVSFVLHELAHAVAVKHFGRRVVRGGVMLYYGMPAAFVDTSDIWLAGRRARMIVSLAGPLCDLLVGSLASLGAALLPAGLAGEAAYRLAAASYLAAICNLNPLLELDGYYILSDWLRLPNLRRRALDFIGGPLWQKLGARAELSREERIYSLYGLLAAAYTALAVALALLFWRNQLARVIGDLWARGDLVGRLVAALIVAVVVVPVGLGLLVAAWGLVAAAAAWVARRGYGRSPIAVAAALTLLSAALAALPLRYGVTVETRLIVPLLWLVALAAQLALHADYRGAAVAPALDAFLAVTVIEVVAQAGLLLSGQILAWTALENIGFMLLLFAGLVALLDLDLRQSAPAELAGSAVLLALAFLSGGMAIWLIQEVRPWLPFGALVLQAAPVYTSAVALALLLPLV